MPSEVKVIAGMQLASALFNLLIAALWFFNGLGAGLATCGLGCVLVFPAFLCGPLAIAELWSGATILRGGGSSASVRVLAIAELVALLTFSLMPVICGGLTLVLLQNEAVRAWFASPERSRSDPGAA